MNPDDEVRHMLARSLAWGDAHVSFEKTVAEVPGELRTARISGFPHSLWDLVEHLRIAQADILAFCRSGEYAERAWPADYWPDDNHVSDEVWEGCLASYKADRAALQGIAADEAIDLMAVVPHGTDQTYLRELLLVIDHGAYHLGQIVALRQALGIWPTA